MVIRFFYFLLGFITYLLSQVALLFILLFVGNIGLSNSLDGPATRPSWEALLIDLLLILLFAWQHSLMARSNFKCWSARWIPHPLERSFYCLMASTALFLLMYYWEPIDSLVWNIQQPFWVGLIYFFFFLGGLIMVTASFLMNHWDLFGLRQVYFYLLKRPYVALVHRDPFLYKKLRHPLYLGFLLAFWFTPVMSLTHLFFAVLMTIYILMGIRWEEKDLIRDFGDTYRDYKKKVPMLFPRFWR